MHIFNAFLFLFFAFMEGLEKFMSNIPVKEATVIDNSTVVLKRMYFQESYAFTT